MDFTPYLYRTYNIYICTNELKKVENKKKLLTTYSGNNTIVMGGNPSNFIICKMSAICTVRSRQPLSDKTFNFTYLQAKQKMTYFLLKINIGLLDEDY